MIRIELTPYQARLLIEILEADIISTDIPLMEKRSLSAITLKIKRGIRVRYVP